MIIMSSNIKAEVTVSIGFTEEFTKQELGESVDLDDAEVISTTKARSQGFRPPTNEYEVPVAPRQMSGSGFYQDWLRKKYG